MTPNRRLTHHALNRPPSNHLPAGTGPLTPPSRRRKKAVEVCTVSRLHGHVETDSGGKRVFFLEFVAAFGILSLIAFLLYVVLTYRPA